MKKRMCLLISAIMAVLLAACASVKVKAPDGVNNNLVYGHLDAVNWEKSQPLMEIMLLPKGYEYETDVSPLRKFFVRGYPITPKLSLKTQVMLHSPIINGVFVVENIEPGEYYLAFVRINTVDTRYSVYLPHPSEDGLFTVREGEAVFFGSRGIYSGVNKWSLIYLDDPLSREEVAKEVDRFIGRKGWSDLLESEM
ncbi:hypothetical protein S1OALGB6SA_1351 [Olavius algarvensis spirochete endosymbiont]|nr:MAG: hypothetical protein [Olavius algarvensis spirochete endosymbiont]VDB00276.1 hypothetical protein S1OALGB6SA_1351 [Olavius algarvensis spirochete endosymbiont]